MAAAEIQFVEEGLRMKKIAAVAALALAAMIPLPIQSRAVVAPGDIAPGFTKTDDAGVVRSLSDESGKVVLIFTLWWN